MIEGNAVELYKRWSENTGGVRFVDFVDWMIEQGHVLPGDVFTEAELDRICELSGDMPEDCEEALMLTAWP